MVHVILKFYSSIHILVFKFVTQHHTCNQWIISTPKGMQISLTNSKNENYKNLGVLESIKADNLFFKFPSITKTIPRHNIYTRMKP